VLEFRKFIPLVLAPQEAAVAKNKDTQPNHTLVTYWNTDNFLKISKKKFLETFWVWASVANVTILTTEKWSK